MKPKKSLGQNFLNNENLLSLITDQGNISTDDIILEIGPGTGNLTKKILDKKPSRLIVIEKDKTLSENLNKKFGRNITIINKDILDCLKNFYFKNPVKVFGNLPYNVSTEILTSFIKLDRLNKYYKKFIFIFQKEVAERIIAKVNSKHYGRLSIISSWKMDTKKIIDINPKYFYPKPKVWSSLITLSPKSDFENLVKAENLEHITSIFFNQRRKMIKKPMKILFSEFEEIALKLDIDLNLRPQNIPIDKYLKLCKIFENLAQ